MEERNQIKNDFKIDMMTDEERKDPNLIKHREGYKNTPVSVYYGSPKKELEDVCLDCKKNKNCEQYKDIIFKRRFISTIIKDERMSKEFQLQNNMTDADIEKIRGNVFIVINCIERE